MKISKLFLVSLLIIFCLSMGTICAADINDTSVPIENLTEDNQNNLLIEVDENQDNILFNLSDELEYENQDITLLNTSDELEDVKKISLSSVVKSAVIYKNYVERNRKLPYIVHLDNGQKVSDVQFTELMIQAIYNIYNHNMSDLIMSFQGGRNPIILPKSYTYGMGMDLCMEMIKDLRGKKLPNYYVFKEPKFYKYNVEYSIYSYFFSNILNYYSIYGKLPTFVFISSKHNDIDSSESYDITSNIDQNYNSTLDNITIDENNTKSDNLEYRGNPLSLFVFILTIILLLLIK